MAKKPKSEQKEVVVVVSKKGSYVPKPKRAGLTSAQIRQERKRTAKCPECSRPVRRRLSDKRIVWHRGIGRKWCVGGGKYKAARPKPIPIVEAPTDLLYHEMDGASELKS